MAPPPEHRLTDLATVYAARVIEAERSLLSVGWLDRVALNEAACDVGVTGSDFVEDKHSFLFALICTSAHVGRLPTLQETLRLAADVGVYLDADDLSAIFRHVEDDAFLSGMLTTLAETVKQNSRNRDRAQTALREGVGILVAQLGFDFDIFIRPREPVSRRTPRHG